MVQTQHEQTETNRQMDIIILPLNFVGGGLNIIEIQHDSEE